MVVVFQVKAFIALIINSNSWILIHGAFFPFFLIKTAIAATPSLSSSQADNEVASSQPEQRKKSISGCGFFFSLAIS